MIDILRQREFFLVIGEKLPSKIIAYAIGGTAMMLKGLKGETLDIDLVFMNENERQIFKKSVESLGKEIDSSIVYGRKPQAPLMVKIGGARIDLFSRNILGVQFSDAMIKRALDIHEFSKNLIIKPTDIHDVLIMKSITGRQKDAEDIIALINTKKIDWNIIIEEAKNQLALGNERMILDLGSTLERLLNKRKIPIPKEVIDSLWNLLKKQVDKKSKMKGGVKR